MNPGESTVWVSKKVRENECVKGKSRKDTSNMGGEKARKKDPESQWTRVVQNNLGDLLEKKAKGVKGLTK